MLVLSNRALILTFDVLKTILDEGRIFIIFMMIHHAIHSLFITYCTQRPIQILRMGIVSMNYFLHFMNNLH